MEKHKTKRIVSIIFMSLGLAAVVFLFFVFATLAVDKFIKKSPVPSFFGVSVLIVSTGSMSGTIEEGDVVIVTKSEEYKIGDIITFMPENAAIPTTHRIIQIRDGLFYTKGDANDGDDILPIASDRIAGKVTGRIGYVGLFFMWLAEEQGWVYILIAAAVIVGGIILLKYVSGGSGGKMVKDENSSAQESKEAGKEESIEAKASIKAEASKEECREESEEQKKDSKEI